MKNQKVSGGEAGFSLIELMIVIGILLLLAGMLIAALPGIQNKMNRQKVEQFIAELSAGLSRYQIDHGIYPPNKPDGDRDESGEVGSMILYKYLSGDFDEDGAIDENEEIYVPKLAYDLNADAKVKRADVFQNGYAVIDAFGNPIRYLAEPPNTAADKRKTRNPTFDLWSIVDTKPENAGDFSAQARYITNWGTN